MAKYIPAWQRTVLAALSLTPWDALHSDEQQSVRAFITEKNKGDADKAEMLLQQTLPRVKPCKVLPLWAIILLWVLGLALAPVLTLTLGTAWLAPALAVCIVWMLCTAKSARMRSLWNSRKSGAEGVAEALRAMNLTALRSAFAAVDRVKIIVMVAVLALSAAVWALPENTPSEAKKVADQAGEITAGKAVMADALALVPQGQEGVETLRQAMRYTAHGSDEELLLAALMWMHIEADHSLPMSDYATGSAGKPMYDVLENTAPGQIDNPEEIAALAVLLRYAGAHRELALTRFLQQKPLPEGVLAAFGAAMQEGRTLPERLALCDEIAAAGHDPLPFLRAGMGSVTLDEAETLIAGETGHRMLLIRAMADAFTQVDDVLAFLRLAKEHGVSAAECYPDGAAVTLDTACWDPYASKQANGLGKRDTFLVLRRQEKPEPYTTFVVPEERETGRSKELPSLYDDYDPDAETGAAQFTVTLEASVLDRMPPERIPLTLADCDALVILDEWYFCDGYVRFTRSVTDKDGRWKHRQIDSPSFGVCQEIAVYNRPSGDWLFSYRENVISSPAMLEENLSSTDPLDWNPADHYLAAPDAAWLNDAYADFLFALERRGWLLVP